MARDLQLTENNTLTLYDPLEKSQVVFTHRTPNTDDRVRYMSGKYKRDGDRLIDRSRSAAIDAALDVLTGIRPVDFTVAGAPLSSVPGEAGYREDWKDLVRAAAGDLLFLMGHDLFEGKVSLNILSSMTLVGEFDCAGDAVHEPSPEETPIPPLAKSSGGSGTSVPRSAKKSVKRSAGRS